MKSLDIFNELAEQITIRINSCNEVMHPNSWIERRQYNDYDLWFVQKGEIKITVQNVDFLASDGDLILFSPNLAYTATTPSEYCQFIFTHFDFSLGEHHRILDNFQLAGIVKGSLVKEETKHFFQVYNEYKKNMPMSYLRLKGSLSLLLARILELYGQQQYRGEFLRDSTDQEPSNYKYFDKILPVFDYVHQHLHQSITVRKLAEIAGMSEKYFITYFKQSLGVTPGKYIYQLKMNRARELLYSKLYSVQEISSMLGYPDPYSFSNVFKKYYHVVW